MSVSEKIFFVKAKIEGFRAIDGKKFPIKWKGKWKGGKWFELSGEEERIFGDEFDYFCLNDFRIFIPGITEPEFRKCALIVVPRLSQVARRLRESVEWDRGHARFFALMKLTLSEGSCKLLNGLTVYNSSLLIENPDLVEVQEVKPPTSTITFKPEKDLEVKESEIKGLEGKTWRVWKVRNYSLKIEPLDLGIEGLPKITGLKWEFYEKEWKESDYIYGDCEKHSKKFEREKYHELLKSAVGKEFTMEVKKWDFYSSLLSEWAKIGSEGEIDTLYFGKDSYYGRIVEGREMKEEDKEIPQSTGEKDTKDKEKRDLIEKNIQEIQDKLKTAKISTEQEIKILGNSWETNYRTSWVDSSEEEIKNAKKRALKEIEEYVAKKTNDNTSKDAEETAKNSAEPTSEQVNDAKEELNNAKNSNNKEEIINALDNTEETAKNSSDEDLKKKREELEDRLGQIDKSELIKRIKTEIESELKSLEIEFDNLSPDIKQKYEELNNDIEPSQAKATRTQILNHAAVQSLDELIDQLEKALKAQNQEKVKNKVQRIKTFINSKNDYKQQAYKTRKEKVQSLLEQSKNLNHSQSQGNNPQKNFFRMNNPLMWLSGIGVIGLGIILVIRGCRRKRHLKHSQ